MSGTVLCEDLTASLQAIGAKLEEGTRLHADVVESVTLLADVDPRHLAQAEREVVATAALHRWRRAPSLLRKLFGSTVSDADQLRSVDRLEYLFLFHRDGHLREAALRKMAGPLPSGFFVAAVAWRLNDWAEPVRRAAVDCAARCFPLTPARAMAEAAAVLLTRQATWGRWGPEREVLEAAFERPEVTSCLADMIGTSTTGPMASLLRRTLRAVGMDAELERLSVDAVQPAVRAAALRTLIDGRAEWPVGWRWRWIDKSMGVRRRETAFETRPLTVRTDVKGAIRRGLDDRAAAVRSVAMSGLIREQAAIGDAVALASARLNDRSPAVRERARFVIERAAGLQPATIPTQRSAAQPDAHGPR